MNYLLHCHRTPGHIVPVPEGLTELMADISREVLRCQPPDLLTSIADYLDAMLLTREHTIVAKTTVDDVMGYALDVATFYATTSMDESRAKHVIDVFRRHFKEEETQVKGGDEESSFDQKGLIKKLIDECHLNRDEAKKAANIIRDAYKNFYYRKKEPYQPKLVEDVPWDQRVKNTLQLYATAKPTQAEMNRAAVCLQSAYRGYCVRKCLNKERTNAAKTIQAAFRGYSARKELKTTTAPKPMTPETAATVLQSAFQGHKLRKDLIFGSEETIKVTDYSSTSEIGESEAAKTIQSIYRGHKLRNKTRWEDIASVVSGDLRTSALEEVKPMQEEAATTIQSAYRGHKTRNAVSRYSWNPSEPTVAIQLPPKQTSSKRSSRTSVQKSVSKVVEPKLEDLIVISAIKLNPRTSSGSVRNKLSLKSNASTDSRH